ncbi:MAG: tetratricopeptide repeat protein [Deltaproteobacteria bacterium]|nr:tetratricopeptide repeat protein [Deltaproteobacteria bacterium]
MTKDTNRENLDKSFESAKKALSRAWDSEDAWDHLEEFAETPGFDSQVAGVYAEALESGLPESVFELVAQRAVNFHDEWFGDAPQQLQKLLSRIIELEPNASWAFNRLTEHLSSMALWDDLFSVYDRALDNVASTKRKKELLEEAANIARDMADEPDRALNYLLALHRLDKSNKGRLQLIERMLEKRERWSELIDLWQQQLEVMTPDEALETRLNIADCHVEKLREHDKALKIIEAFLQEHAGHRRACALGEAILADDSVDPALRMRALDTVLSNYQTADQPESVVRVVEIALTFAQTEQKIFLYRKAGATLSILGKDEQAMASYGELLVLAPADGDANKQLRLLAVRSKRFDLRAEALIRAAVCDDEVLKVAHLTDAAELYVRHLNNAARAIEIYSELLSLESAEPSTSLKVAHNLNELLAAEQRDSERLSVLEQIAILESTSMVRRTVYQEAAKLAEQLTMPERALEFWNAVLKENENDLEALTASIRLMHQTEQWEDVVAYLQKRAAAPVLKEQRRSDLVEVAVVQLNYLEDPSAAIKTWKEIFEEFGPRPDCVSQLDALMSQEGRFDELAELLVQASTKTVENVQGILSRLGDISKDQLELPEKALNYYRSVLALERKNPHAVAAVKELTEVPETRASAVHLLEEIYRSTEAFDELIMLTELRLSVATDVPEQVAIMMEAARTYEKELRDAENAFTMYCRALPESPDNSLALENLVRLAEVTEMWRPSLVALKTAAEKCIPGSSQHLGLLMHVAKIQEEELEDLQSALSTCVEIASVSVANLEIYERIIRLAAATESWSDGLNAFASIIRQTGKVQQDKLQLLEEAATSPVAFAKLAETLNTTIIENTEFTPLIQRELNLILSNWYMTQCDDAAKAKDTLKRAVDATPDFLPARRKLAEFQRKAPSKSFLENLKVIFRLCNDDLDPLMEAATVAVGILEEYEEARIYVVNLYDEASKLWRMGTTVKGRYSAEECVLHAVTQIAQLDLENGLKERAALFLLEGAKMPFDEIRSRFLRKKAASIFAEINMNPMAIDVYNQVLTRNPDDMETLLEMDALLEKENRILELLGVRQKRLELTSDPDLQLTLRLEISSLGGMLEGSESRLALLKENLTQTPGEARTIEAIHQLLEKHGRFRELVELFNEQANFLLTKGESSQAAFLFETVASVAQNKLGDVDKAIAAHRKVVELKNNPQSLDALAKLYTQKGDLAEAVDWLKRRLQVAEPEERVSTMIRLARTQLKIGQVEEAVEVLENAFDAAPQNAEVRKLLLERYRELKLYQKLADALERSIGNLHDNKTVLTYAREAAYIIFEQLNSPRNAVSVLQKIVTLQPDAKEEQTMLAEALLDAERYDEARVLLEEILEAFGRRRSPGRAAIHAKLAHVINAQGDTDDAILHLEQAVRMDSQNIQIARELAEMAGQKGDLDLAERTYRSLLMTVRRGQSGAAKSPIGPAEILLELSFIAKLRGQEDKDAELQESTIEALRQDDSQASALEKRLLEAEEYPFLVKILESRLGYLKKNVIRARVLGKLADILEYHLEQRDKAFEIRLKAVTSDPGAPQNHDSAIRLAKELDLYDEYVEVVENQMSTTRRDVDALTRCELLLRIMDARIEDEELEDATELFEQAKKLDVREVDVIRAGARLAEARGDDELQVQLLTELSKMGESGDSSETHVNALFRLAEIHLGSEETFDEGIEQLDAAFTESGNCERAGRILKRLVRKGVQSDALLHVFERVSKKSDDKYLMLEYFEMLSNLASTTPAQIQDGARLALELDEKDRAEKLMERIIDASEEFPEFGEAITWAMLGLGHKRLEQKDLAGAVKWFHDAAEIVEDDEVFEFGAAVARCIFEESDDLILGSRVYEKLLEMKPGDKVVWEPLSDIYLKLGNIEGFECLVEETMYSLESTQERNALRQKWARMLLDNDGREADAVDVLKNILLDEPGHSEALALLSDYYKRSGREEELIDLLKDRFSSAADRQAADEVKGLALELGRQLNDRDEVQNLYRRALSVSVDDSALLKALIETLDPHDDARERLSLLERTLRNESGDDAASLTLQLVSAYREMDDGEGATRTLKFGFERAPGNSDLKKALEHDYRLRGDFDGLVEMLKSTAAEVEDVDAKLRAFSEIADLYKDEINDVTGELDALIQMAEFVDGDLAFTIRLIDAFRRAGKYDEALEKAQSALDAVTEPQKRYELLLLRSRMLKSRGDVDGALDDLEMAVSINEEAAESFETLLLEKRSEAAAEQDVLAEKDAVNKLTGLYLYQERVAELTSLLQSWLAGHGEDVDSWRQLLQLHQQADNHEGVIDACKKLTVLTSGEEQLEVGAVLTRACLETGELEIARRGLEYIYKENIDGVRVRDELKMVYEKIGAFHELATLLAHDAKSAEDVVERAELFRRAGHAYLKAGDPSTALLALNESLSLEPDNIDSALLVIDIEIEQGDLNAAEVHADAALEAYGNRRTPQQALLLYKKAVISKQRGDRMEQMEWLEQAATSNRTDGVIAAELAELAEELEQWETALKALRNISLMKTNCPMSKAESFFRQGRISYRTGDEKRAVLYLKKALQEDRDHGEAEAFLQQIS